MRKMMIVAMAMALIAGVCFAGEDTSGLGYLWVARPSDYTNNTMYSIAEVTDTNTVDLAGYKGIATLIVAKGPDETAVAITNGFIRLQHSHSAFATGGNTNVSGITWTLGAATTGGVYKMTVPLDTVKRYLRLTVGLHATNAVKQTVSAVLVLPRLSE